MDVVISDFANNNPTLFWILIAYISLSGLAGLAVVRPPLAKWWHSQFILIGGSGVTDLLLKKLGYRIVFELCVFVVACIYGSLGGWIYVLTRKKSNSENVSPSPKRNLADDDRLNSSKDVFRADGVLGDIPYRVLPNGEIDALMHGAIVRFRDTDHLLSVINAPSTAPLKPRVDDQFLDEFAHALERK